MDVSTLLGYITDEFVYNWYWNNISSLITPKELESFLLGTPQYDNLSNIFQNCLDNGMLDDVVDNQDLYDEMYVTDYYKEYEELVGSLNNAIIEWVFSKYPWLKVLVEYKNKFNYDDSMYKYYILDYTYNWNENRLSLPIYALKNEDVLEAVLDILDEFPDRGVFISNPKFILIGTKEMFRNLNGYWKIEPKEQEK